MRRNCCKQWRKGNKIKDEVMRVKASENFSEKYHE